MKYEITYLKRKKKGYSKQVATFFNLEDVFLWETMIKTDGAKDIIITPK